VLALVLIISFALSACAQPGSVSDYDANDENKTYLMYRPEPIVDTSNIDAISDDSSITPWESIFVGEGEAPSVGGDALDWYIFPFESWRMNAIHTYFIDMIGRDEYARWNNQFARDGRTEGRSVREFSLLSFVEDNNLTLEDMIRTQEAAIGMSHDVIDAYVYWAKYGIDTGFSRPGSEAALAMQLTQSDLAALFSGDIGQLWAAFAGHGVFQNNRVYSGEWILNNIEQAVNEEQIPLGEIWRIISMAEPFEQLEYVVESAIAFLENGPIEITGNGDGFADCLPL